MKKVRLGKANRALKNIRGVGKFEVFENSKGETCIGNNCFRIRAGEDAVHIAFNPNSRGCPKNMDKAMEKLITLVGEGKPTQYRIPKPQEEGW